MINNSIYLFGIHKEIFIENASELQEAFKKWESLQLKPWLKNMEINLIKFRYSECCELIDQFQPHNIQTLPNQMSETCEQLKSFLKQKTVQYEIVLKYLTLLRQLHKSLQNLYNSKILLDSIHNMELYLCSPINQNLLSNTNCECSLI